MPVLLQAALGPLQMLGPRTSLPTPSLQPCVLPPALSALRHGDFPHSTAGSKLPVCALRSRDSPASHRSSMR